jgi:hypothetical protein
MNSSDALVTKSAAELTQSNYDAHRHNLYPILIVTLGPRLLISYHIRQS